MAIPNTKVECTYVRHKWCIAGAGKLVIVIIDS